MAFDAFLFPHERGTDRRWRRLSVPERWCAVAGVEAIASKAPERGCLLIANGVPAEAEDFAELAGVTVAVARSTIAKMRRLDLVVTLDDGVEVIADWLERQKDPRHKPSDSREAWKARKAAQRERERIAAEAAEAEALVTPSSHADVTRDTGRDMSRGHAGEVKRREVEGKQQPPQPPASGGRRRERDRFAAEMAQWREAAIPTDAEHVRWRTSFEATPEHVRSSLSHLHPHASPNGRLLLGCGAGGSPASWLVERFGRVLDEAIDGPYELVDCGCPMGGTA